MSIFDNKEKELIEQETEEALQRASDERQKELDEAEQCEPHIKAIIVEQTLDSTISVIKKFLADNGFTVEEFSDLFAQIKEIGNNAINKN